jgi:hypothetical protein
MGDRYAASRGLQGGFAIRDGQTQCTSRSRLWSSLWRNGKYLPVLYVATVYHFVHLGPRYASTSCQVILSSSLPTSMAPWTGLVSSAGLFNWTLAWIFSLDLDLNLDLECPRSRILLSSRTSSPTFSRSKAISYTPPSLPKTHCAIHVEIILVKPRGLDEAPYLGQLHAFGDIRHCCDASLYLQRRWRSRISRKRKRKRESQSRARSCSEGWWFSCQSTVTRVLCRVVVAVTLAVDVGSEA